jgi:nitrite reductase/ring-hydroxylating ferredoxin subunit
MPDFVRVAAVADIPAGTALRVVVGDTPVALYHVDGEFYATHDVCSHALASLSNGTLDGYTINCPKHGARFDVRTGRNLCLPAVRPVKSFAVKVEGEDVYVAVP